MPPKPTLTAVDALVATNDQLKAELAALELQVLVLSIAAVALAGAIIATRLELLT